MLQDELSGFAAETCLHRPRLRILRRHVTSSVQLPMYKSKKSSLTWRYFSTLVCRMSIVVESQDECEAEEAV